MKLLVLPLLAMTAFATGCAHVHPRGSVVLAHSPTELDICIGSKEVKAGDRVAFFETKCTGASRRLESRTCTKKKLGEGVVSGVIDEHFSTVKLDGEFKVLEGTTVEKL